MSSKRDNNNRNKWIALINIPLQMGIIIFLFSWFGGWLDERYLNTKNTNLIIFTLLGVFIALYNVIRQVNDLNK
ncbi:AtpZ/AtpI family protein [Flavobacterium salilacus subsp. salilacus]|uniref:AtpZ/AtpI family protein n=1 Tax=Flavobacterium TaxID=237 RepID=UPI0010752FFD|nr:AtpZ/AtpI family protein [Flavobacterium salilacus]KAF2518965.1 AtpZ/AtpI family protein [Flavobacterium salilacus subsp. salilacus]MBE1614873.1 AtpZ/AtpI family protein [Flavobacterium sp. SaA2.13]NDI98566.1 AtpZ/AtpI family protein [Flavobacterium salilacus subsp. altitudinum]